MSAADEFRAIADECRAIPAEFGLREHTASIVTTVWSGAQPGDGDETEFLAPITVAGGAPPKVRFPSQKEIALGFYAAGQVVIGPFTPSYGTGGVDRNSFNGSTLQTYDGLQIRVTGPQCPKGALYRVDNSNVDHALHVTLTCSPVGE
jgi:hypothetical protein